MLPIKLALYKHLVASSNLTHFVPAAVLCTLVSSHVTNTGIIKHHFAGCNMFMEMLQCLVSNSITRTRVSTYMLKQFTVNELSEHKFNLHFVPHKVMY